MIRPHVKAAPARPAPQATAVLFSSAQGRGVAQRLLATKIGAGALIVAPQELATHGWVAQASRYCSGWVAQYHSPDRPIEIREPIGAFHSRAQGYLRIYSDYCSCALWENGSLPSYQLDLPFMLMRKIAAWQWDFDHTVTAGPEQR